MHSQQTFNECIAQADGCFCWLGATHDGLGAPRSENIDSAHMCSFFRLNGPVLTYFPAADSQEELQNIALLLLLKLLDVCSVISSVICPKGGPVGGWAEV